MQWQNFLSRSRFCSFNAGPPAPRKFSDKNQLSALRQKLETNRPPPLATVRPTSNPADNDLLIGACMASGDTTFIRRILENFANADDSTASDGLRMGFLQSKFGATLVPKEREPVTVGAAGEKYQCKTDPAKLYRLLTLSSAFWALQSLSQRDDGIRKTLASFFEQDTRLRNLLAVERTSFENYVTLLVLFVPLKYDHASKEADQVYTAISKSALTYETLGSARDAFAPADALVKSGKKPN